MRLWFHNGFRTKTRLEEFKDKKTESAGKLPGIKKHRQVTVDTKGKRDDKFFNNSEGLKLTRKLILKLKQEVEDAGGRLAVIHFVHFGQVHDYPTMPLKEFDIFLAENDIPHLNLFPKYAALEKEDLLTRLIA